MPELRAHPALLIWLAALSSCQSLVVFLCEVVILLLQLVILLLSRLLGLRLGDILQELVLQLLLRAWGGFCLLADLAGLGVADQRWLLMHRERLYLL